MAQEQSNIAHPHEHDVLSGRGNFVNYHAGNEHFRALVRKYKVEYVKCPKPQKGKFSKMIVDEILARNPPGRFLKQEASTKLWYDIGEKKALDKTRQALREGAPELMKEMTPGDEIGSDADGDRPVQKDGFNKIGSNSGGGMPAEVLSPQFMNAVGGFQSPGMNTRNPLTLSPHIMASPHLLSPGLLMNAQISPAMQQLSANSLNSMQQMQRGAGQNMTMSQMLPPPQVHRPTVDHLVSPQQQQMMMINQQRLTAMQQQQQFNTTQLELEQAMLVNAKLEQEMQMMQSKLNTIYANDAGRFEPTQVDAVSNNDSAMMPPPVSPMPLTKPKVDIPAGQNSRRKPPPSLLVREDSLKINSIFGSPGSSKKKYDANTSSGALSAMSLSLADMQDEGNLSAVFDNSVRISKGDEKEEVSVKKDTKLDSDMSVLGGNMSINTMSMHESSEGNMSFGNVFEDPYKLE